MEHAMQNGSQGACYFNKNFGFTYIGLLIFIAISGIALAGVGIVWHQDAQREREKELLFIGEEFRNAIGSYYENSPSATKQFPQTIDQLIFDSRFPNIKRHIRKLYKDPLTQDKSWGLEMEQGHIVGVYSISEQKPIKKVGFSVQNESFGQAGKYSDWKFIYIPGTNPTNVANQNAAS